MTDGAGSENISRVTDSLQNNEHLVQLPETTPLISFSEPRRSNYYDKALLVCLGLILVTGVSIGTYLLCVEGEDHIPERFFLVSRDEWSTLPDILNVTKLSLPSERILLMQTNTKGCLSEPECLDELRDVQREQVEKLKEADIMYNFIVGGDGRVYEGRGWKYRSPFQDDGEDLLTVALLGNYDEIPPSREQYEELKAFLDYSIMRNNLIPCFRMLVPSSRSRHLLDIAVKIEDEVKVENMC